ncbi:MAG: hypothetical protein HC929_20080 [Leptolyngbyaceae cyanobacterium SM2_5_2]|nr:hypothetical protein [Leptolyngbyaceae cyanobacterium SM2_5_2]
MVWVTGAITLGLVPAGFTTNPLWVPPPATGGIAAGHSPIARVKATNNPNQPIISLAQGSPSEPGPGPAQISFATPDGLFAIQPVGGERQPLRSEEDQLVNRLIWSPNGQELALVQDFGTVYRLDRQGTRSVQIFSSQCPRPPELGVAWQRDNATLLIKQRCNPDGPDGPSRFEVFLADSTGQLTALTSVPNQLNSDIYISPDGAQLAYVADQHIYVVGVDGSTPRQVTQAPGIYGAAGSPLAWSPDSQQLAFYEGDYPFQKINLINVNGSNRRLLTPAENFQIYRSHLVWSPDGRYIATYLPFNPPFSNQETVALINVNTGEVQTLTQQGFYSALSWSPDSQKLAFGWSNQLDEQRLFLLDVATQAFTALTLNPCRIF